MPTKPELYLSCVILNDFRLMIKLHDRLLGVHPALQQVFLLSLRKLVFGPSDSLFNFCHIRRKLKMACEWHARSYTRLRRKESASRRHSHDSPQSQSLDRLNHWSLPAQRASRSLRSVALAERATQARFRCVPNRPGAADLFSEHRMRRRLHQAANDCISGTRVYTRAYTQRNTHIHVFTIKLIIGTFVAFIFLFIPLFYFYFSSPSVSLSWVQLNF